MDETTGFIGRARETERARELIRRRGNVLVHGRPGVGKSAFLRNLFANFTRMGGAPPLVFVPSGTTKQALLDTARQIHEQAGLALPVALLPPRHVSRARRGIPLAWDDLVRTLRRLPVSEVVDIWVSAFQRQRFLVFFDSVEMPPSQADYFAHVCEHAQVVAAKRDDNRRVRIDRVLWRFPSRIELKPLPLEDCSLIAGRWLAEHPIRFSDDKTRKRFVRHVAQDSDGVPAAILGMLEAAAAEETITPAKARSFQHEAGVRYMDMTPVIIVGFIVFAAMRFMSRGMSDTELYVISGIASVVFIGLRFFMWRLRA